MISRRLPALNVSKKGIISRAAATSSCKEDQMQRDIRNVAEYIRSQIKHVQFQGSLSQPCEDVLIPSPLIFFLTHLIEGGDTAYASRAVITIAEIAMFNFRKTKRSSESSEVSKRTAATAIIYFIFVRSFREANYYLYKRALRSWIPWFSVFDHYQYLRYATAHIVDLGIIDSYNSDMSNLLIKGVFTANKTGRRFSNIPTDQNHEQVNKELKSSGGISGLLNTTGSLERFLISAPIVSQLILEFESNFKDFGAEDFDTLNHHSESKALQIRFVRDCEAVTNKIIEFGNPFSVYTEITSLYTNGYLVVVR